MAMSAPPAILGKRVQELTIPQRHELAALLTEATGGELLIGYNPTACIAGAEEETRGLVFSVSPRDTDSGIEFPADLVPDPRETGGDVALGIIGMVEDLACLYSDLANRTVDALDPFWIRKPVEA